MKSLLLILLITFLSFHCVAQITYQKGYFINKSGDRIECLIKNNDWKDNPTEFQFKVSESADSQGVSVEDVNEFGIYDESKYINSSVNIDISSDNNSKLSDKKEPEYIEKQVFLKVLVDGEATLYEYIERNLQRFFYSFQNDNIQQLIYKRYKPNFGTIAVNSSFKGQLWDILRCEQRPVDGIEETNYRSRDLVKLFVSYNSCVNSDYINFLKKNEEGSSFNFTMKVGLRNASLEVASAAREYNVDFGNKTGLRVGLEMEYVLPVNKNKWAVFIEPAYSKFKAESESKTGEIVKVDYGLLEIPVGIRHYMFLKNNSSFYLNGLWVVNTSETTIDYQDIGDLIIRSKFSLAFGVGYKYKNYGLEFRYGLPRNVLGNIPTVDTTFKNMSLNLCYTI